MEQKIKNPVVKENLTTQLDNQVDENDFQLYPLTCATRPSKLRYKIIDDTVSHLKDGKRKYLFYACNSEFSFQLYTRSRVIPHK